MGGREFPEKRGSMRLFLALVPDDSSLDFLKTWQKELQGAGDQGRPVARDHLHLTLRFVGQGTGGDIGDLSRQGERIFRPTVENRRLDRTALLFETGRIKTLGVVTFPGTHPLFDTLPGLLDGFPGRPFWPHITLFRKRSPLPVLAKVSAIRKEPESFCFSRLCLFESVLSENGSRYRLIRDWPLDNPDL